MKLNEIGVEVARKATALQFPGTWMDEMCLTFTRAYLSALPSSPVSDLVDELKAFSVNSLMDRAASTLTSLYTRNAELEREVKRLREAQQWQPMETAPKDGTEIIARDCATGTSHVTFWNGGWHDPDSHYYSEAPDFVPNIWFPLLDIAALSTSPQGGEHE